MARAWIFRTCLALLRVLAISAVARGGDGDLDPSFGIGGKVWTGFDVPAATATSIALQPDGKIVAAGWLFDESANMDFAVARYHVDGTSDETFGDHGRVRTDFFGMDDVGEAVALQPDGKIIVAGNARVGFDVSIALARYNANGTLDAGFGIGGKAVVAGFTGVGYGVAVQPDGKILVSGSHFALVRFNGDGTLDAAFGKGGKITVAGFGARAITIQSDSRVVVVGSVNTGSGTGDDFAVVRFNADGSLDKTFGSGGLVTTDFFGSGDVAWAVALDPNGRIVAGGYAANSLSVGPYFAIARYTSQGSPDSTFSLDGRTTTDLSGFDEVAFGIAVQSDGKILAAGQAFGAGFYDFAVVRYTSEGVEDPNFGASGRVTTDFFGRNDGIRGIVIQPDGNIVAAGGAQDETIGYLALTRYLSTASPPAPEACPHSAGFWKKHTELWPVGALTLGSQSYSVAELLRILSGPVRGDASILLARETIATKFNIASGTGSPEVAAGVASADGLLATFAGKLPYNVRTSSAAGRVMVRLAGRLASRNNQGSDRGCPTD